MFTGIIETLGQVQRIEHGNPGIILTITGPSWLSQLKLGDSVAVNGVCLTVATYTAHSFSVYVVPETLSRTNLGTLTPGSSINLERAAQLNARLDGHLVTGHIDATGTLIEIIADDEVHWLTVQAPFNVMRLVVEKGSITLDGISLTVVDHTNEQFRVTIVPHTWDVTNLQHKRVGDTVNLEADLIGKYVQRLIQPYVSHGGGGSNDGK